MSGRNSILVVRGGANTAELVERLTGLELDVVEVESLAEAEQTLRAPDRLVTAALVPVELADGDLKSACKKLRRTGPATGISFLAYGMRPDRTASKRLRSAGIELALWVPFDDGALRFQINRALTGDRDEHGRDAVRVPTFALARVRCGGREKDAVVYSLSESGAFLETPRASMESAEIEIELRLPTQTVTVQGRVVFSNVPGNLQRPNLPLGMGVRFLDPTPEESKLLGEYVELRLDQLRV